MASVASRLRPTASFVDPQVLGRIGNLELLARTVVDGFINGLHRSPYLGLSLDFAEHRAYMPGDDIRRIDWRLYARTDRYYMKEFDADTNTNFFTLLDISRSMVYSSGGLSKLDYGRYLAACLTYFSHGQRDRVGLATFDAEVREYVPPSAKHLDIALHVIDRVQPGKEGVLAGPMLTIADRVRRRGIMVLISDLYEEPAAVFDALKPLVARGNDLIVFHLLDPAELDFPFQEATVFKDAESGERVPVIPEVLREKYRELVAAHTRELSRVLTEARVDYVLVNTSTPLDFALFNYLSARERLSRVR